MNNGSRPSQTVGSSYTSSVPTGNKFLIHPLLHGSLKPNLQNGKTTSLPLTAADRARTDCRSTVIDRKDDNKNEIMLVDEAPGGTGTHSVEEASQNGGPAPTGHDQKYKVVSYDYSSSVSSLSIFQTIYLWTILNFGAFLRILTI